MTRVFVPSAAPPRVTLSPDEAHHLTRVLRARAGDAVVAFDGRGREWDARIEAISSDVVTVQLLAVRTPAAEPAVRLVLGVALLKGDQMDDVVRDATMMGAAAIVPVLSDHVAVPDQARRSRSHERWTRVAVASAKQCGRATVPDLMAMTAFGAALAATDCHAVVMCVEPAAAGEERVMPRRPASALVLVGPEGGWSAREVAQAQERGAHLLTLGPRTLRAEIAPVVAISALWTAWDWP
jgi:16S rRNA (uracil1498-N3)-methyltransferase